MIVARVGAYLLGGLHPGYPVPASSWTNWTEYSVCWTELTQVSMKEWSF